MQWRPGLDFLPVSQFAAVDLPLLPDDQLATLIRVEKAKHTIEVIRHVTRLALYPIRLGGNPRGHKLRRGDERTPEGRYTISERNSRSKFHLALRISYPDDDDQRLARERGDDPGGDIMIHGGNHWWRPFDWTDGCIALSNRAIEQVWERTPVGTPIEIVP